MIRIGYVGDLIFGDQPVLYGFGTFHKNLNKDFFKDVAKEFSKCDYVLANFEAIIKENILEKDVSNWSMVTTQEVVTQMKDAGIRGVSIANNHTMDYDSKWFDYTVTALENVGIDVFGKKGELSKTITIKHQKVTFFCFSDLTVKNKNVKYELKPSADVIKQIAVSNSNNLNVVYCHWGNEFIKKATKEQIIRIKDLLPIKPEVIVGHHAHVLQDNFLYDSTPVFLSLGNFVSDYWQSRAKKTLILIHEIEHNNSEFYIIDCEINNQGIPKVIGKKKKTFLENFSGDVVTNHEINKERWRLRREYLFKIVLNFYKIKGKRKMIKWLYLRFVYILNNYKKEKENPNIIYEEY